MNGRANISKSFGVGRRIATFFTHNASVLTIH